jgi:hypothetical protein
MPPNKFLDLFTISLSGMLPKVKALNYYNPEHSFENNEIKMFKMVKYQMIQYNGQMMYFSQLNFLPIIEIYVL